MLHGGQCWYRRGKKGFIGQFVILSAPRFHHDSHMFSRSSGMALSQGKMYAYLKKIIFSILSSLVWRKGKLHEVKVAVKFSFFHFRLVTVLFALMCTTLGNNGDFDICLSNCYCSSFETTCTLASCVDELAPTTSPIYNIRGHLCAKHRRMIVALDLRVILRDDLCLNLPKCRWEIRSFLILW